MNQQVDAYDIDLFDTLPSTIQTLKNKGVKVICYLNAGQWEPNRPDASQFPTRLIGKKIKDSDNKWLNIADFSDLTSVISARMDLAKSKGCDAIDADNVNVYLQKQSDAGFIVTY